MTTKRTLVRESIRVPNKFCKPHDRNRAVAAKGFEIFAVSLDEDKESWLKAIEMDNLKWEHVSDLKGNRNEASLIYGINGIPDNFLISENGKIIGGDKLNQKLKEILK